MKGEKIRESAKCKSYFNLTNFFKSTFHQYTLSFSKFLFGIFWKSFIVYLANPYILSREVRVEEERIFFFLSSSVIVCQRRWFARDAHMSLEKKNNCGSSSIQCQGSKETLNFLQRGCCQLMQITKEIQDVPTSFRHKAQFLKRKQN